MTRDEPTVRAQEAAARFSDKTAAELIPVSAHATQAQSSTPAIQPAVNLAAEQKAQAGQQPAAAGPKYTGEPISVNLKDVDLKDFFRLIHEISGLNVVLDPNVHGTLTIVLDDVPWDQALDIVLKNNDLARELEGNVLRIATVDTLKHEADSRRAQVESEALAVDKVSVTRFLSYAKAKDVIVTVKKFLSQRGDVVADDRTNAVIINDIPKTIPTIDRLLTQLDRKTQEVEIEARVVAATRQFARDIGTQFGFGWGDGHSAIGGNAGAGSSPTTANGLTPGYITTTSTGSGSGSTIPLFSNLGVTSPSSGLTFVNASNTVRIDMILSMAESRGLLKVLSRPRVVTQNNIQALGQAGRARADRDAGAVGRSSDRYLRRRVPAVDGDSADHVGKHHLPERRRGKHHAELRSGSAGQPGTDHAAGHHAGAGDRWRHGGDRRRHSDAELDQHHAGADAWATFRTSATCSSTRRSTLRTRS